MSRAYWFLHHAWMEVRAEVITAAVIGIIISQVLLASYLLSGQPAGELPGTGDDVTKILVPQSPGLQSAEVICDKGEKQSRVFEVVPPPPEPNYEYVAELGADHLRWVDSGNNRVALLNGATILLSDEVMECFRDSR